MIHKVNLAGSGTFDPVTGTYVSGAFAGKMQEWELQQEENLRYVEVTRAIHEFCEVS